MNVAKSKVMRSTRDEIVGKMIIVMDNEVMEKVVVFKYLGPLVTLVGGLEARL